MIWWNKIPSLSNAEKDLGLVVVVGSAVVAYRQWFRFKDMPQAGLWYLWLHMRDTKSAVRNVYEAYKQQGMVKVFNFTRPFAFQPEVLIFDLDDCIYCHKNEGLNPGGAGDVIFTRQTRYFGSDGPDNGLGPDSHGRRMFGRGHGHNLTRDLVLDTPMSMQTTDAVRESARRCVDFVEKYPNILDWIRYHQIDMFMAVMIGKTPDLANPDIEHPLRQLPEDEEHAFVSGLILSIFPINILMELTTSLETRFVKAMDNMTTCGVKELRDHFLSLPPEKRPDSFMKSLLEKGTVQDAEELMALFITAFQGNIALTLHNMIFWLSNHPEKQERLHQECVEAYNSEDPMRAEMKYYAAVLQESHRLTPITDITQVREYDHDLVLPSGRCIPRGAKVEMLNQWSTRDADKVPNVNDFIPERYLGTDVDRNLSHYLQYSEFGSSSRSCLGQRTARVMLKSVVIELFRRYRLESSPPRKTFSFDKSDPAFNRIVDYPKILLHLRAKA